MSIAALAEVVVVQAHAALAEVVVVQAHAAFTSERDTSIFEEHA